MPFFHAFITLRSQFHLHHRSQQALTGIVSKITPNLGFVLSGFHISCFHQSFSSRIVAVKGLIHFFNGNNDMQPGFGMKVHRSLNVSGVSSPHDLVAVLPVLVEQYCLKCPFLWGLDGFVEEIQAVSVIPRWFHLILKEVWLPKTPGLPVSVKLGLLLSSCHCWIVF